MLLTSAVALAPAIGSGLLDPKTLIESFGTAAIVAIVVIVFIETGLLFPFLPGDSLLFTAGALVAQSSLDFPLWALCGLVFVAAFLGDQLAYAIGRRLGPKIFNRPDSKLLKREHLDQAHDFFVKHGGKAVLLARFVPIIRTYAAVAAGAGKMHYPKFLAWNALGAFLWGVGVTLLGYALGTVPFVNDNIDLLLVLIVVVSLVPVAIEWLRGRAKNRREKAAETSSPQA